MTYPTIVDPCTGQPFPNNQIPRGDLDPAIQKIISLFPLPNVPHPQGQNNLNNYARNALTTDDNESYDARIDWTPSPNNVVFGRYNYSNRNRIVPGYLDGLADGATNSAWGHLLLDSNSFVIGWTHVFRRSVLNDLRLGFIRDHALSEQLPFSLPQTASEYISGIPNVPTSGGGLPLVKFSTSYAFLGSPIYLPKERIPQQFQYNDTLVVSAGKHNLKFGVAASAPMRNLFQDEAAVRGSLDFEATFTHFAYADGLLGLANQVQLTNSDVVDQRLWLAAGFLQDDWRILPQLTLNLGLRYEFSTPPTEGRNHIANFDPDGNGSLVFAHPGSLASRALVNPNTTNFGPRVASLIRWGAAQCFVADTEFTTRPSSALGVKMNWR